MKVLVLGAGKMVEAILVGLSSTQSLADWGIYSPSGVSAKALAEKTGASFVEDITKVKDPQWILLGCKPQQINDLRETLNGRFQSALYLSMLAALTEKVQCETLQIKRMIRIMPNLSVKFKEGVTLLSSGSAVESLPEVEKLFSELGMAKSMKEDELEELTLLTGSGPALVYEFARSLSQSFTSLGDKQREDFVRQVLMGAGVSCKNEVMALGEMIDAVTSKGGVTIAVLEEWRKQGLNVVLDAGIKAGKVKTAKMKKAVLAN